MSQPYGAQPNQYGASAQNLQFYSSSYPSGAADAAAPSQGNYGFGAPVGTMNYSGFGGAAPSGVSGRMGEQGGLRTGWIAAFSTEGYDGEPPLLEELGVNFGHVKAKTLAVLNPFGRIDRHMMDDSDLAGPILLFFLFGSFLLFSGRVHFGYIYGLALMGTSILHTILSLMTPDTPDAEPSPDDRAGGQLSSTLTLARSASVLGYCLLPLVITSLIGTALPLDSLAGYLLTSSAICWSTLSSSAMFCAIGRMSSARGLVAYPVALFYVGFGIVTIFSSRGSGALDKVAGVP